MRAEKVGKKASCFDFPDADSVMLKVKEELCELEEAMATEVHSDMEEEMGDLLLTLTSLCRKIGVEPEVALCKATNKFIDRFSAVESCVIEQGLDIKTLSMEQLDAIWEENKEKVAKNDKKS